MTSRSISAAILPLVALAILSCSKTQDTAPERRIFGDPPVIQSVEPDIFNGDQQVNCDFAGVISGFFCENGIQNVEFQAGKGWPDDGDPSTDSDIPGVFIEGHYSEVTLKARVTDPNSPPPPAQSNILLVSASYRDPDPQIKKETSIVLFDDGSSNKFTFPQKVTKVGEACEVDFFGNCTCPGAKYDVTSGDDVSADGLYTRKLAMLDKQSLTFPGSDGFFQDCILRQKAETPILRTRGELFTFKVEAVDRQGNLATWPTTLSVVIGTSSFACSGDECGCCVMQASDPATSCHGLPGSTTQDMPDGICRTIF